MIKISVVVPIYNAEKFIKKCVDSIINQSLKEIEIILINDGSRDNSLMEIQRYKNDNRVISIDKINEGASKTRNLGIDLAKGKYIYFVDADDYLENEYVLEKLYSKCEKEDLDILIFDYYKDFGNKKEYMLSSKEYKDNIIDKKDYFYDLINEIHWGTVWNRIIKLNLYKKNFIEFPTEIFFKEDLITNLKLTYYANKIGKI